MKPKPSKDNKNAVLKYSGLAVQLFVTLAMAAYIGRKLDANMGNEKDYVTILFVLVVFLVFMYKIIKDLS